MTSRRNILRGGALALLATAAIAPTTAWSQDKPTLFKIITVKDEIVIGLNADEMSRLGGSDAGAVSRVLAAKGESPPGNMPSRRPPMAICSRPRCARSASWPHLAAGRALRHAARGAAARVIDSVRVKTYGAPSLGAPSPNPGSENYFEVGAAAFGNSSLMVEVCDPPPILPVANRRPPPTTITMSAPTRTPRTPIPPPPFSAILLSNLPVSNAPRPLFHAARILPV